MKKLIFFTIIICCAFGLIGCASTGSAESSKVSEVQTAPVVETQAAPVEAAAPQKPKSLDEYLTDTDFDIVYEVVNTLDVNVTVASFLANDAAEVLLKTSEVTIPPKSAYQFKYKTSELAKDFGYDKYLRCFFFPEGMNGSRGWSGSATRKYWKHTVSIVKNGDGWSGQNAWYYFGPILNTYETGYDCTYEIKNTSSYPVTVQGYVRDYDYAAYTDEVVIPGGKSYVFKFKLSEIAELCKNTSVNDILLGYSFAMPDANWYWGGMECPMKKNNLAASKGQLRNISIVSDGNGSYTFEE